MRNELQRKALRDFRYLRETVDAVGSTLGNTEDLETSELWHLKNRLQTLASAVVMLQDSVTRMTVVREALDKSN